jgi:hypothetical protein
MILLSGCMLVSLAACSKTTNENENSSATEQQEVSDSTADTTTEAETSSSQESTDVTISTEKSGDKEEQDSSDVSDQIKVIEDNKDVWSRADYEGEEYSYTVTDLDHDGYLEIITATLQGSGFYTYFDVYEVSEDKTKLVEQPYDSEEGESLPDIIETTVDTYTMPDGTVNYAYTDILRASAADGYELIGYFSLDDGKITITPVASKYTLSETEEESTTTYADADDKEITEDDFNAALDNALSGATKGTQKFQWIAEEDWNDDITDQLKSAYETFANN